MLSSTHQGMKLYSSRVSDDGGTPKIDTLEVGQNADGPRFNITGNKEIILSAGVFGTPQILLLSGIGLRTNFPNSTYQSL
ncbi:hypothetical protein PM082_018100 [Marasmius tenuissimus]|nr:hypothetical protein PM082_018100 [Marasmius tenuissimus]